MIDDCTDGMWRTVSLHSKSYRWCHLMVLLCLTATICASTGTLSIVSPVQSRRQLCELNLCQIKKKRKHTPCKCSSSLAHPKEIESICEPSTILTIIQREFEDRLIRLNGPMTMLWTAVQPIMCVEIAAWYILLCLNWCFHLAHSKF